MKSLGRISRWTGMLRSRDLLLDYSVGETEK